MASRPCFSIPLFLASSLCIRLFLFYPRIKTEKGKGFMPFNSFNCIYEAMRLIMSSTSLVEEKAVNRKGKIYALMYHTLVGGIINEKGRIG